MRLTYTKKSKDIREKTLKQLRNLRKRFEEEHPELLERIKNEVQKQPLYDSFPPMKDDGISEQNSELIIDKKKNLITIARLVQNGSGSEDFQIKLKNMLLEVARNTKH